MPARAPSCVALVLVLVAVSVPVLVLAGCKGRKEAADRAAEPPSESVLPPSLATRADRPAAATLTPDEQATVERVMDARDEIAGIAEARAGECDKAASEIEALIERNRALLAAGSNLEADPTKRAWIREKYGPRMLASSTKLMALIERCDRSDALTRIFQSLE